MRDRIRAFVRWGIGVVSFVVAIPVFASDGHVVGNPGEYHSLFENAAWFPGENSIRYCVEVSPSFEAPGSARSVVADAFEVWRRYLAAKRYGSWARMHLAASRVLSAEAFETACDGREGLRFYLGATPPEGDEAAMLANRTLAYAKRTAMDLSTGRARGYVWVAPSGMVIEGNLRVDWRLRGRLLGTLVHEIGHVLGCEHVAGTIMRAEIGNFLFAVDSPLGEDGEKLVSQVELEGALADTFEGSESWFGRMSETGEGESERFLSIVGSGTQSRPELRLQRNSRFEYELELRGGGAGKRIPISFDPDQATLERMPHAVFRTVTPLRAPDAFEVSSYAAEKGWMLGALPLADGSARGIVLELNLGVASPRLFVLDERGRRSSLFIPSK